MKPRKPQCSEVACISTEENYNQELYIKKRGSISRKSTLPEKEIN
jgi:hypothetical protein